MAWQYISPEVTVKGFRGAVYPTEWMELKMMLWNDSEDGNGSSECTKDEGAGVKTEIVSLLGKGR